MSFYLTEAAISNLSILIVALIITAYLLRLRDKSRTTWFLAAFFATQVILMMLYIYADVVAPFRYISVHIPILQYLVIFTGYLLLMQFAYHFPYLPPQHEKEVRIVTFLSVVFFCFEVGIAVFFNPISSFVSSTTLQLIFVFAILLLVASVGWTGVVLLRRTVFLAENYPRRSRLSRLWSPGNRRARATRAFALLITIPIITTIALTLREAAVVTPRFADSFSQIGSTIFHFIFAVVYFNHTTESTSFLAKILGISLATMLIVLGLLGQIISPFFIEGYRNPALPIINQPLLFEPTINGFTVSAVETPFREPQGKKFSSLDEQFAEAELPFIFAFNGQLYTKIFISDNGVITFSSPFAKRNAILHGRQDSLMPLAADFDPSTQGSLWIERQSDHVIVTWAELSERGRDNSSTFQLTLWENGSFLFNYQQVEVNTIWGRGYITDNGATTTSAQNVWFHQELPLAAAGETDLIENHLLLFRQYMHERLLPLAYIVLAVSGLILFGFPYFFRYNLIRPLGILVDGVTQVNEGNLAINLPVRYRDEIGFLTESFNGMTNQLNDLVTDLETKVSARTEELATAVDDAQEARAAAEHANKAKSTFLANMSHELRTPLNAVIGYSELLEEEVKDLGHDELLPDLHRIKTAGKLLLSLVNDVLDLSKIEAGRMELLLESFNLSSLLHEVEATIQPLVRKHNVHFKIHTSAELGLMHADMAKLHQSLLNLLSNACKFSKNGAVTLKVERYTEEAQDWFEFAVIDTGIGMSPEQARRVFEAFQQAEVSTSMEYGGTGLGLTITKHFCEMMGGSIMVETAEGVGSTFTIRLPAAVDLQPSTNSHVS